MSLPDWRQVARQQAKQHARQRKAWPVENDLLTLIVEYDDMGAARELDRLLRDRREKVKVDRGNGGKVSGLARADYNDKRVLAMLGKFEVLPPPRNLVAKLVEQGIGRNPARAALKRLAARGQLQGEHAAHFRT